jgi:hypothetical protein
MASIAADQHSRSAGGHGGVVVLKPAEHKEKGSRLLLLAR